MKALIRIFLISSIILAPKLLYSLELHNLELVLELPDRDTTHGVLESFGISLTSGDVNGDGFSDIIVGKTFGGDFVPGKVYIHYGGLSLDTIPDVILTGSIGETDFGQSVATGDVNGDEFDDLIIRGSKCRVYFGGSPMDTVADLEMEFATSVAAGDINGDGFDDIIRAYYTFDYGLGKICIHFGGSDINTIPDIMWYGENGGINFGQCISSGFDVNDDGYEDLFVSAPSWGAWVGKTYIYYGGNPMDTIPDVEMLGQVAQDFFGRQLCLIGDLENDEYDDACVGKSMYGVRDKVFTYWGGNPMDSTVDLIFEGDSATRFGYAVDGIKRVNLDSFGDLIVGACYHPIGIWSPGKIFVYLGKNPMDTSCVAFAAGTDSNQIIGGRVANAGDVDGDGKEEFMFSNYFSDYTPKRVWVCKYTGPGIEEDKRLEIGDWRLEVYPNPFTQKTDVRYQIPDVTKVSLKVYDTAGRLVKKLVDRKLKPGYYTNIWDGTDEKGNLVASGVYIYKLRVEDKEVEITRTKKMLFLGH